jgi:hypothetical protein
MNFVRSKRLLASLLLLTSAPPLDAKDVAAPAGKPASHQMDFRRDDVRAQRIAKKLLRKEISQDEDAPAGADLLWTAWAHVSPAKPSDLFVLYGCSPDGNCGLYGLERSKGRSRLVRKSLAHRCSMLRSSHGGRRDISAYMHGSATDGTLKIYWWHKNRYVRVSERNLVFK